MLCGLEIHQRLLGDKLFCRCPQPCKESEQTQAKAEEKAFSFSRSLHAVKSELGESDEASEAEFALERSFRYIAPPSCTCLVEADEEPPHPPNEKALNAVLAICRLFSSNIVDEIYVMRKNVIDGSNTSGFQRTMVVGIGGSIDAPFGKLPIQTICLEEESAGILESQKGKASSFDLSRLGIPLVEISTAPVMRSGKEAEQAALAIGTLLRKTGLVSRGIGTIRQDLNISIPEGARVEIKGVQDLSSISNAVELEAMRQAKLSKILQAAKERTQGKVPEAKIFNLTELLPNTGCKLASEGAKHGLGVYGIVLPYYAGLLGLEIGPNRRFGTELADYARSCGLSGIMHSDEDLQKYGFSDDELFEISTAMSASKKDAYVIAVGEEKKATNALFSLFKRAYTFAILPETRRANPNGTSSYMRPLPGRARMYPETDLPPIPITAKMLSDAERAAQAICDSEKALESALLLLNSELASQLKAAKGTLSFSPKSLRQAPTPELSAYLLAIERNCDPKLAASAITNTLKTIKREGANTLALDDERLADAIFECQAGSFTKAAMPEILKKMCESPQISPKDAARELGLEKISEQELERLIFKEGLTLEDLASKYKLRADLGQANALLQKQKKRS